MIKEFIPNIKVEEIIDNEDGSATMVFNIKEEIRNKMAESLGWDSWSDDKFQEFFLAAIEDLLARENKQTERNLQNPDFLWSKASDE